MPKLAFVDSDLHLHFLTTISTIIQIILHQTIVWTGLGGLKNVSHQQIGNKSVMGTKPHLHVFVKYRCGLGYNVSTYAHLCVLWYKNLQNACQFLLCNKLRKKLHIDRLQGIVKPAGEDLLHFFFLPKLKRFQRRSCWMLRFTLEPCKNNALQCALSCCH